MYHLRVLCLRSASQCEREIVKLGGDAALTRDHLAKANFRAVKLERISARLAQFLYQEFVLEGGDAILPQRRAASAETTAETADLLLWGTAYQFQHLAVRIRSLDPILSARQDEGELEALAGELEHALAQYDASPRGALTVRATEFAWGERTFVMGILNVTPDSFSGDGVLGRAPASFAEQAAVQAERMVADGADIVDVGGESTRPGSQPTPADQELRRVIPAIAAVRRRISAPISVDTYRAEVARAALDAGADIVNDVWGLRMDPEMKRVVAERRVPVVVMHNRSRPKDASQSERLGGRYVGVEYADLLGDVVGELREQIELGLEAGIEPDRIIVDPGIGFGKTREQSLELLNRTDELRVLGYPLLIGPSRKGFIGYTLDLPVEERVEGTAAAVAVAITRGADMVRVHDVKAMARVARMTDALVRA